MIHIKDKKDCCGCTSCASICTHNCITMVEDSEGYKFPRVDADKCVECGLCEKACPMLHPEASYDVKKVIGAKHKDASIRKSSSSGGIFFSFAENFINEGGVVVGCAMSENLEAKHVVCTTIDDLIRLRSSKYVQSNTEGIYAQVRSILREGKKVLFSGTPCQVAGLRRFLIKDYDNLFCIDILCHGVPSPKLFREYKESKEKEYGAKANFVSFRCKKHQWKRLHIDMLFDNGKEYYKSATYDPYMQTFLSNKSQRNSCFYCPFNTTQRQGDISLGDFWGIGKQYPELDDDKGITMILVNSEKGQKMYDMANTDIAAFDSTLDLAIAGNAVLIEHLPDEDRRNEFYKTYLQEGMSAAFAKHTTYYPAWRQYYLNFMRWGLDLVRKIQHKSY